VAQLDPKLTFGDTYNLKIGRVSTAGGYGSGIGITRSFVEFDTTGIPDNSLVLDAELQLYMYKSVGGNLPISVYTVNSSWAESNTTWSSVPWLNNTITDTTTVDTTTGYKSWNVTAAVRAWVPDRSRNFGLMLQSDYETWYWSKEFYSSDTENGLGPIMKIRYAMLENTPDITTTILSVGEYKDKELRLEWTPVPYAIYYEVYRASTATGPFTKLGATWDTMDTSADGSLNNFFYDDIDGGYPDPPTVITTDRGGLPGTIRVMWLQPSTAPAASPEYYYRIKAIGEESRNSILSTSPTVPGQLTPTVEKYQLYSSSAYSGPWTNMLVETDMTTYSHSGLGPGKLMYYRLKSVSSESYLSTLSKVVWGRSNRPPTITGLYISPTTAYTNDYLTAKYTFSDADGDSEYGSQIRWYRDGKLVSACNDKISVHPFYTAKDQIWYFTVNPKDSIEFGTVDTSGMITILNSAPVLTNVKLNPSKPTTSDNLDLKYTFNDADSDSESGTMIRWYKDGQHQQAHDDKGQIPSSATSKGELWNASVCTADGTDYSIWYHPSSVTIKNSLPVASGLQITPANPRTGDTLNVGYLYFDADSDAEFGSMVKWYKDDILQPAFNNLLIIPATVTLKDEVWYFTVTPNDGEAFGAEVASDSVKIGNTPPEILSLSLLPAEPKTGDYLWIEYDYFDIDGDMSSGSEIRWYRDDVYISELTDAILVQSSYTTRGEQWRYSIKPRDGFNFGLTYDSSIVTIQNTAPEAQNPIIEPAQPAVAEDLIANFEFSDPDDDSMASYSIKWFRNSEEQIELTDLLTVPATFTGAGESWHYEIFVADGFESGPVNTSISVNINTPPEAINVIISPATPVTTDELIANYEWSDADSGDAQVGIRINWYRNSELVENLMDSALVTADHTAKGENWQVSIVLSDGKDYGTPVMSAGVTIGNTPPAVSDALISPTNPTSSDELTAIYKYVDLDSDTESGSVIKWFRNEQLMDELTNNNVVGTSMLTYGSYWYFTVEPGDGDSLGEVVRSPTVIIRNSAPEVSNAVIIPNSPTTADGLEAKVELSDKDNDENFKFDYDWYKDDILQTGLSGWNSVSADMTARGEVWYFTVSVSDGKSWSPVYQSDPVTIVNSVPEATELSISLEEAFASTPLYLEYTYFDLDSDPERGTEVRWYLNDLPVTEFNDKYMIPSYMLTEGGDITNRSDQYNTDYHKPPAYTSRTG
jgi:hypothetical protein